MPKRRSSRAEPRRSTDPSDSSPSGGDAADAEESRHLGAAIEVCGRVQGWRIPAAALRGLLRSYLQGLGYPDAGVTLRLVGERSCRALNRRHRAIDAPTDVLSFPSQGGRIPKGFDGYLGDLALCLPYAWRKRGRFAAPFAAEASFLILHGLLHLSGRHHDRPAQERALWRLSRRLHPLCRPHLKALAALRRAEKGS